jgi:cell division inhibitor SulA/protein ImuA
MSIDSSLSRLLEHPLLWRGRAISQVPAWPTGFAALDDALPGGGWPRSGLVELLIPRAGVGELSLLAPLLARASTTEPPRWTTWISPPFEPFAPALAARGVRLDRQLVVRTELVPWAFEQALGTGACELALAWASRIRAQRLRRLVLAAERGRSLGVLLRPLLEARETSPACLRLQLEPCPSGVRVHLLKSRGGARGPVDVAWEGVA